MLLRKGAHKPAKVRMLTNTGLVALPTVLVEKALGETYDVKKGRLMVTVKHGGDLRYVTFIPTIGPGGTFLAWITNGSGQTIYCSGKQVMAALGLRAGMGTFEYKTVVRDGGLCIDTQSARRTFYKRNERDTISA